MRPPRLPVFLHLLVSFSVDGEDISNTHDTVLAHIPKLNTSTFVKKYSAGRRISNSLLGVWKRGNTFFRV